MIHGNHDDPGGESNLCAANLLEAWALIIAEVCDVEGITGNLYAFLWPGLLDLETSKGATFSPSNCVNISALHTVICFEN